MQFFTAILASGMLAASTMAHPALVGQAVSIDRSADVAPRATVPEYETVVLENHNVHRANHSANALTWSTTMYDTARTLALRCEWQHNTSIGTTAYGQNLAAGWARDDVAFAISAGWYGEAPLYKGQYGAATPNMSLFEGFGHFTQVVWQGSTQVGCFTYNCANSAKGGLIDPSTGEIMQGLSNFTVCNYSPPGNYIGEFGENVQKPLGHAPYVPQQY